MATVTNTTPSWKSYMATGNVADIVSSPTVATAIGGKMDAVGGQGSGTEIFEGTLYSTDIDAALSTAANTLATGTMARTPAERSMAFPQPHDFLNSSETVAQLISGQIDVGPVITRAFAAGCTCLMFPAGTYLLASAVTIPSNASIIGAGQSTIFSVTDTADNLFSANSTQFITLRDFVIQAAVTRTGGAAIYLHNTFHVTMDHVLITNGAGEHWSGISLDGANDTHIRDCECRGPGGGFAIGIGGTSQRCEDTFIDSTNLNGYATNMLVTWSSGAFLSNMDILSATGDGIYFNPSSPQEVDGFRASIVLCDSNTGAGIHVAGSGSISEVNFTNCWASTNGSSSTASDGLILNNSAIDGFTMSSSDFHNNYGNGINALLGQNLVFSGNTVCMNSLAGSGKYNGMIVGSSVSYMTVTGGIYGAGQTRTDSANPGKQTNYQNYGIYVSPSATGTMSLTGIVTRSNVAGGISVPTVSTIVTAGNVGT